VIPPRKLQRLVRFLIFAGIAVALGWVARSYGTQRIPAGDQSLEPRYPAGSRVVYREVDADDALPRGADVIWTMRRDDTTYARFGCVRGLPGDVIGSRDGVLTVNGEPIGPVALRGEALGTVPEGEVCILALSPMTHSLYVDSRTIGFVPRADVLGIIRFRLGD